MASFVRMIENDLPLIDPAAWCHACGVLGTVGRAIRYRDEVEITHVQFCATCWLDASTALQAEWNAEDIASMEAHRRDPAAPPRPSTATTFASATWHGTDAFLRDYLPQLLRADDAPSPAQLREIAEACRALVPDRVGSMPDRVAQFIAVYGSPERPETPF